MKNVSTNAEQVQSDKSTRYYSQSRPILPGGFPEKEKVVLIQNFDQKNIAMRLEQKLGGI